MKKLLSLLLVLSMCAFFLEAAAAESTADTPAPEIHACGSYEYIIQEDGTAAIVRFTDFYYEGDLEIPNVLDGIPVTVIADEAFFEESVFPGVTNPVLPEHPDGVFRVFDRRPKLPDGTTDYEYEEPEPEPLIPLINLENVQLEFSDNFSLIGSFNDENEYGIKLIPLEELDMENVQVNFDYSGLQMNPDEPVVAETNPADELPVTPLPEVDAMPAPFSQITGIAVPEGVTRIGISCFTSCIAVTRFSLPDSLTCIDDFAFSCCASITTISLPANLTRIGHFAFANCFSLTGINLPDSVTEIGSNPFDSCPEFRQIAVSPFHPYLTVANGMLLSKPDKRLVCCPSALAAGSVTIPDGVEIIGSGALSYCPGLTGVVIPDSVSVISNCAFEGSSELTAVTIPGMVKSIGQAAFLGTGITEIVVPGSVDTIGAAAFAMCSSLRRIQLENGVRSIGKLAFAECDSLNEIVIPETVSAIGKNITFDRRASIIVAAGSYAEQYCLENGYTLVYAD